MLKSISIPPKGSTWLEIVVMLALVAILASLSIPTVGRGLCRSSMTQALSNMRQLHLATRQMSLDHEVDKNPVRWTCSNTMPLPLDQWKKALAPDYLSESDLKKILSVKVDRRFSGTKTIDAAINVFAVADSDDSDTLLFATKNWHGPEEKQLSGEPYGSNVMVVFRKGGAGMILLQRQITNKALIGGGGLHAYLPLQE